MRPDYRGAIAACIAREAKPVDKYGHQPRLYALACQIGAGRNYDDDVVYAAAWLHDLGVFVGHRPEDPAALAGWDNVGYAMKQAPRILESVGFPAHKVAPVVEAIRTHQPSFAPATIEGVILRDADILEQLGAVGILRQVSKVGRDTRYPTFSDVIVVLRQALESLPAKIRLETTQALAQPRIRILEEFLQAVEREALPGLF